MLRLIRRLEDVRPDALLEAGLPLPLARLLWARGVRTQAEAQAFLHPSLDDLHDPLRMHGMAQAVLAVREAMAKNRPMVVYGDYDVDGVCASALLVEALRSHGAHADVYTPSRHREGYGLNVEAVERLAARYALLISVDCGINAFAPAEAAAKRGMTLVITDHHEPADRLPDAAAVVNPLLGAYPFRRLCGAGVAWKLVWALFGREAAEPLLELAALATVADMVPLLGENRIIVAHGLRQLNRTRRAGLRALIEAAGLADKTVTAGHLGFQLAPRINAGGRLAEAGRSVEMLLTQDEALARRVAEDLNAQNAERQRLEAQIVQQAEIWVRENVDFLSERALVVVGRAWNPGVVGLAASRLAERFAWPAVVLTEQDGMCTGSARSIPGVNIFQALSQCADLFERFGGHAQAAGVTLKTENVPAFRRRLSEAVEAVAEPEAFVPAAAYDLEASLDEITVPLIEQLDRLAPTGFGNPAPVFRLTDARVLEARAVGSEGKHLRLRLAQAGTALDGIAFGQGEARSRLPERVDVLFSPSVNEWMGRRSAQCEVERLLPHSPRDAFAADCLARADAFDLALLEAVLDGRPMDAAAPPPDEAAARLREGWQGTLLTVRTLEGARRACAWLERLGLADRVDYCFGRPQDPRRFHTLCAMPQPGAQEGFAHAYALDDARVPAALAAWLPDDNALRALYRALRAGVLSSEAALSRACGLRPAAVRLGLTAFAELSLIDYQPAPFRVLMLPAAKCRLEESAALRAVRARAEKAEEEYA